MAQVSPGGGATAIGSRCSDSFVDGGSRMVTELGSSLRGPIWPSGSMPLHQIPYKTENAIARTAESPCVKIGLPGKTGNNGPMDGETTEQLVPQAPALSDGRETTVLNLLGVEFKGVFEEFGMSLYECGELADVATFLAQGCGK